MSTDKAPSRKHASSQIERRRWWFAAGALFLVAGLQLATIPPALFAEPNICLMDCNEAGRSCCCKEMFGSEPTEPHAPEAEAFGRVSSLKPQCRDLCDGALVGHSVGSDVLLLSRAWHQLAHLQAVEPTVRTTTPYRRLDHSDPSILPRPPPIVVFASHIQN